jgi:hypothetical protein
MYGILIEMFFAIVNPPLLPAADLMFIVIVSVLSLCQGMHCKLIIDKGHSYIKGWPQFLNV